jgi:hypothetical protein
LNLKEIRDTTRDIINEVFKANVFELIQEKDVINFFRDKRKEEDFIITLDNGLYIDHPDFNFDSTRMYYSEGDILK